MCENWGENLLKTSVTSSVLATVAYDPVTWILELEFLSGWVYLYYNIPEEIYLGLLQSSSKGNYFTREIRDFGYFERIG